MEVVERPVEVVERPVEVAVRVPLVAVVEEEGEEEEVVMVVMEELVIVAEVAAAQLVDLEVVPERTKHVIIAVLVVDGKMTETMVVTMVIAAGFVMVDVLLTPRE